MNALRALASLKLTLVALILLGAGIVYAYLGEERGNLALVLPLVLLSLNLIAAVATNPAFRKWNALLVFHLALIVLVLLAALGRLTYLKGTVELATGEEFGGRLIETDTGTWHPWKGLEKVRFINEGFTINYAPEIQRERTRNKVRYLDGDGSEHTAEIGDQTPLVLAGYRFYTSPNKGFAPTFVWHPADGEPVLGTVHLPSYPIHEYNQAREWQLPGTDIRVWTMLKFDEVILDPNASSEFRLPNKHELVVRIGGQRHELQPGQAIELPRGRLVYEGLRSWMGYSVFYDWTIHWMLAVSMVAVGALGWHFWKRFAAKPWNG
jgi:cytochrome c biogenesis protein